MKVSILWICKLFSQVLIENFLEKKVVKVAQKRYIVREALLRNIWYNGLSVNHNDNDDL